MSFRRTCRSFIADTQVPPEPTPALIAENPSAAARATSGAYRIEPKVRSVPAGQIQALSTPQRASAMRDGAVSLLDGMVPRLPTRARMHVDTASTRMRRGASLLRQRMEGASQCVGLRLHRRAGAASQLRSQARAGRPQVGTILDGEGQRGIA